MRPNSPDGKRTLPTAGTAACRPKRLPRGSSRKWNGPSGRRIAACADVGLSIRCGVRREHRIGLPGHRAPSGTSPDRTEGRLCKVPAPLPPDKPRTGTAFPLDRVPGVYYLCLSNRESVPYISIRIMEQFIMANDTALRISDSGRGETTLALLHGYLESLEVWEDLAKRLAPYYRIVAIDIPGHGISQVRGEVHTMDFVADTLQAVLEKLGVRRCFLAGHSMGGYAAEAFAERHSDMLQGLILFHSTPNADTEQKKADRLREIELIRADKKELLASQFAPKGFAEENRRRLRDRIGQLEELTAATDDDGIVALLRGMIERRDMNDMLHALQVPQLFIFGRMDGFISVETAERLAAAHPQAEVAWLEHSGHMGFWEEPEASERIIRSFIGRHGGQEITPAFDSSDSSAR